jgi:hypothetical protein
LKVDLKKGMNKIMTKKLIFIIFIVIIFVNGCGQQNQSVNVKLPPSRFTIVDDFGKVDETGQRAEIIKDTETEIEYLWIHEAVFGGSGGITPLLDKDGRMVKSK